MKLVVKEAGPVFWFQIDIINHRQILLYGQGLDIYELILWNSSYDISALARHSVIEIILLSLSYRSCLSR